MESAVPSSPRWSPSHTSSAPATVEEGTEPLAISLVCALELCGFKSRMVVSEMVFLSVK